MTKGMTVRGELGAPFFSGLGSSAGLIVPFWRGFPVVLDMADAGRVTGEAAQGQPGRTASPCVQTQQGGQLS